MRYVTVLIYILVLTVAVFPALAMDEQATELNNEGVRLCNEGELDRAISFLEQAFRLAPESEIIYKNLANAYIRRAQKDYEAGQYGHAESDCLEALRYYEKAEQAYVLLGDIYYKKDEQDEALKHWQKALSINPGLGGVAEKIKKTKKELKVEKDFRKRESAYFDIKFDSRQYPDIAYEVLSMLDDAYRNVGWHLDFYPKTKISVIIYSGEQFKQATDMPHWVLGFYGDKIRINVQDLLRDKETMRRTLYHEYTHALIAQKYPGGIPRWLNEAIAQSQESDRPYDAQVEIIRKTLKNNTLMPLKELEDCFSQPISGEKLNLAYVESRLVTDYILYRYNYYLLNEFTGQIHSGKSLEAALEDVFCSDLARFEENWKDYIRHKYL